MSKRASTMCDSSYSTTTNDQQDYNPLYEDESAYISQQKKQSHNEAEKKRIRTINKCVDDLRDILDKANIQHKADKVSTLEAATTYMKSLLKERDRLTTTIGYMGMMNPNETGISNSQSSASFTTEPYTMHPNNPSLRSPSPQPREMYSSMGSRCESTQPNGQSNTAGVDEIDYRKIWMDNNIATAVVHIETGQILQGNNVFMELFQFSNTEEINRFSLFDIIVVNDLSLFWSEYSQLVNCNRQIIRSFVVKVTNPLKGILIPCLITMGPIMDYEGFVFQVSVSFTPVTPMDETGENPEKDASGHKAVSLEKII